MQQDSVYVYVPVPYRFVSQVQAYVLRLSSGDASEVQPPNRRPGHRGGGPWSCCGSSPRPNSPRPRTSGLRGHSLDTAFELGTLSAKLIACKSLTAGDPGPCIELAQRWAMHGDRDGADRLYRLVAAESGHVVGLRIVSERRGRAGESTPQPRRSRPGPEPARAGRPRCRPPPAGEPLIGRLPRAIAFRQVTPRSTGPQPPQHPVDHLPVIPPRTTSPIDTRQLRRDERQSHLATANPTVNTATGDQLPEGRTPTIRYPHQDPAWNFDFSDSGEIARRLPRLAALYLQ